MWLFALTIFLSAFLLFQVQPLMGKWILPWFGGGPAVWTTCLLFFQVILLAGYGYAHFLRRHLGERGQMLVHAVVVAAAVLLLPIGPSAGWRPDGAGDPTWRVLAVLAMGVGLPYFVLSATSPLVQAWFSVARPGASPYRLYARATSGRSRHRRERIFAGMLTVISSGQRPIYLRHDTSLQEKDGLPVTNGYWIRNGQAPLPAKPCMGSPST